MFLIMFLIIFLVLGSTAVRRNSIDLNTPVGNCSNTSPVYAKPINLELPPACYPIFKLVRLDFSFEKLLFIDINTRQYLTIRHITAAKKFVRNDWQDFEPSFERFGQQIEYVAPHFGQLIYIVEL